MAWWTPRQRSAPDCRRLGGRRGDRVACPRQRETLVEWTWIAAGAAALIIGIAKTSFGGLGSIAVALLALSLPTKESTAAALLLLITGDIIGVLLRTGSVRRS